MNDQVTTALSAGDRVRLVQRVTVACALVGACAVALLLSIRPLASPDLGYHLAYGEQFLDTGRPVDCNPFLYTVARNEVDRVGDSLPRPAPGPACWYDRQGRYRFPNANWLSQVVMAAAARWRGWAALAALRSGLVLGMVLLVLWTARRLGVRWVPAAAGVLLVALAAYPRFALRPELFGYVVLAGQAAVLAARRIGRRAAAGIILLQLLLVNFHSYFLLGLALTAAVLADRLLRVGWHWLARADRPSAQASPELGREARCLAAALAGQVIVCFVNPWTWRLAALPVQTLLYLQHHGIAGGRAGEADHPWARIGEFLRPFGSGAAVTRSTMAHGVLLALAAAGATAAAMRRRWAWLIIIGGFAVMSLSMSRNIAPAVVIITPPALAALASWGRRPTEGAWERFRAAAGLIAAGVVLAASAYYVGMIVTQRFYYNERFAWRFGTGLSPVALPLRAAQWLSENRPAGRVWTDCTSSSNVYYFTRPHPDVPVLTNTWAYPPDVMDMVLRCSRDGETFRTVAARYGVEAAVLRADSASAPLVGYLMRSPDWFLVDLDACHVVFLRADGPNGEPARRHRITEESFDARRFIGELERVDPAPAYSLHLGALTLTALGMDSAAVEALSRAVELAPRFHEAWNAMGFCLVRRGDRREAAGDVRGREDLRRAKECFLRCLQIEPGYEHARQNLLQVQRDLARIESGR